MCDLASTPARAPTGQFLPGRSGNPAGRPLGSRNRSSLFLDQLDDGESEAIVRAVVDRALAGDRTALRACFTRLIPPAKQAPVEIDLPEIASASDVADAGSALIAAVAAGVIAPGEAQKVMRLLTAQLKLLTAPRPSRPCISPVVRGGGKRAAAAAAFTDRLARDPVRRDQQDSSGPASPARTAAEPLVSQVEGPVASDAKACPEPSRRACISPVLGLAARRAPAPAASAAFAAGARRDTTPRHEPAPSPGRSTASRPVAEEPVAGATAGACMPPVLSRAEGPVIDGLRGPALPPAFARRVESALAPAVGDWRRRPLAPKARGRLLAGVAA